MKGLKRLALLLTLAHGAVCAPAFSAIVTIDPDGYAPGTNLSHVVPGVTLSTFASPGDRSFSFSDVYASQDVACVSNPAQCRAVTGTNVFSMVPSATYDTGPGWHDSPGARYCFQQSPSGLCPSENFRALLISFENPTDYVEIGGRYLSDTPLLIAFDAARNMLSFGSMEEGLPGGNPNFSLGLSRYQSSLANISYVVAAGWSASAHLDVLRYDDMDRSVPEPGTALLFGVALLGFALAQRSRTVRTAE